MDIAARAQNPWLHKFVLIVLVYLCLQSATPNIERVTYWGEMMVIFCIPFLLNFSIHNTLIIEQKNILFAVFMWTFVMPIYGIIISQVFWATSFQGTYLVRHLVFFYYCTFFFFAYKYTDFILPILKKWALPLLGYNLFTQILWGGQIANIPLMGLTMLGVNQWARHSKRWFYLSFVILLCSLLSYIDAGTGKVTFVAIIGFLLLNGFTRVWTKFFPRSFNRIILAIAAVLVLSFGVKYISAFNSKMDKMIPLGYTIAAFGQDSRANHTDLNGYWRLVLWSHLYGRFVDYPLGVGLATPLFEDWLDGFVAMHFFDRPGENYIQGAHNSFITFITRLGVPALLLFLFIFANIAKLAYKGFQRLGFRPLKTKEGRMLSSSLIMFLSCFVSANFNVFLESPLHAGMFWFSLGLFTRIFGDYLAQNEQEEGIILLDATA